MSAGSTHVILPWPGGRLAHRAPPPLSGGPGAGGAGYGSAADRTVLLRWNDQLPDPVVHVGDWIGLSPKGVRSIDHSIAGASNHLLNELIAPTHELVTIIEGEGSSPANTRRITEFLADEFPHVAVEVHHGGQPLYPYYFGIE